VYRVFIHLFEGISYGQDVYFIERLPALEAFPVMHGPIFDIQLKAEVIFLKEIRPAAKRTHEWFHNLPSDLHRRQILEPEGVIILFL
jgi:hypothetical protein